MYILGAAGLLATIAGAASADTGRTWSIVAASGSAPGQVTVPASVVAGPQNQLFVGETTYFGFGSDRVQARDTKGAWSVIASPGSDPGQVSLPASLALDAQQNLYVSDSLNNRVQERDAQGNWTVIAASGTGTGQVNLPGGLALDTAGDLFVADAGNGRVEERDARGNWSIVAANSPNTGQVTYPTGLAVDGQNDLYVAESSLKNQGIDRIQKRDAQGNWSLLATAGAAPGQVVQPSALAVDSQGNLFVAEFGGNRVQERDAQGNWSVLAPKGGSLGQVRSPVGLGVDSQGSLYVADSGNSRVQEFAATTPAAPVLGDANGDNKVNLADATIALRLAVGLGQPSAGQTASLDFNGDGRIDVADVTHLLRFVVGLIPHL